MTVSPKNIRYLVDLVLNFIVAFYLSLNVAIKNVNLQNHRSIMATSPSSAKDEAEVEEKSEEVQEPTKKPTPPRTRSGASRSSGGGVAKKSLPTRKRPAPPAEEPSDTPVLEPEKRTILRLYRLYFQ